MRYNLGNVRNDIGLFSGVKRKMVGSLGLIGGLLFVLVWAVVALLSLATAIGIPVGILWCIFHYIHNGYRW